MAETILCLNAGSSSLKFALFALGPGERLDRVAEGEVSGIGTQPRFVAADKDEHAPSRREWPAGAALGHEDFLGEILDWIGRSRGAGRIVAAGHRVVHGGTTFRAPVIVEQHVLAELGRLVPLAPLHQPHNLAAIRALAALRPELAQVACFDTA
ncbi:MAG: acetate/propionate family kinase, partial [Stellaceae bacterium]